MCYRYGNHTNPPELRSARMAKDGFVETSHGRIHYLEAGSASDVMILLHSNGGSAYEFEDVLDGMAETYRVLAWDMPGHGDSEPIAKHYSVMMYADAVIAFMDALGVKKASVLGSSIGGAICVALGAHHADRIDVLYPTETPTRSNEVWTNSWATIEKNYCNPVQTFDQVAPRFRHVTPHHMDRWNVDRQKAGARTMLDVMWALREYDVFADIPKIATQTCVIFGDKGPTIAGIDNFRKSMPGADVVVMEDCGHFPMNDDPAELTRIVNAGKACLARAS
jgi:3-oxoadipate enol-lactonase